MSPIYVRPEREQAEHDRLIRFLQAKYSKKFEAIANPGEERVAPVKVAANIHFPDLVLNDDKRLAGVVEIETAASVNNLETMAKWVPFSRARVPFHLYVPVQGYEAAMRLVDAHRVKATEIWTYRPANEGFDLVRMFVDESAQPRSSKAAASTPAKSVNAAPTPAKAPPVKPVPVTMVATVKPAVAAKPARVEAQKKVAKPTKGAKPAKVAKPAKAVKAAKVVKTVKTKPAPARPAKPAAKAARKAGGRKGR